jgi:hypothetical protein
MLPNTLLGLLYLRFWASTQHINVQAQDLHIRSQSVFGQQQNVSVPRHILSWEEKQLGKKDVADLTSSRIQATTSTYIMLWSNPKDFAQLIIIV